MTVISTSLQDTFEIAQDLTKNMHVGDVYGLVGDLGAGKTAFVQGVASALGVEESVTSPTFVLWRQYQTKHPHIQQLHHLDLYRLESDTEVNDLGLQDIFNLTDGIVLIEWADKYPQILPEKTIWMTCRYIDENTREFSVITDFLQKKK